MTTPLHTPILDQVDSPVDLRTLELSDLRPLCQEIRDFLIDSVAKTGGHLGAGLGTVELAVALHYAFNTPEDKVIWDVGHQAYPHKIITGRKDRFHTIRQYQGLSGFLKRKESPYDVFGAGHATTSISAALGVATARDYEGEDYKVVAVIGDGSMTGGMAYEAMNNCGLLKKNMIVVLNDNNMSISPNVWAISNYFNELVASPTYNRFRANVWELAGKFDDLGDRFRKIASRVEGGIKAMVTPGVLWEALGFRYFGPINGHNVVTMVKLFREVQEWNGPVLVHVVTQKGKGYAPAEADNMHLHGVTPFDKITGKAPKKAETNPAYTTIFGNALVEIVRQHPRVVGITAAMSTGTGLDILEREVPDKYFDVGIAEPHGVTFAAGMATEGYVPVVAIYSTFLQRAIDQVIHDVALQDCTWCSRSIAVVLSAPMVPRITARTTSAICAWCPVSCLWRPRTSRNCVTCCTPLCTM
jgi:1-deoxy-D-xylulose-5-phosphate synthase